MDNAAPDIIVLKFSDSKIPVFKEARNKEYIKYGEKNDYPEYLTYLFNKSAKHNAILTGKANYIFGKGFENGDFTVNRLGESLNDIIRRAVLDIEIYGGFRFEVVYNRAGKISEIYHVDYTTVRVDKDGEGYWFKECWDISNREEEKFIPAFNPSNPVGTQMYAYNEYRPMTRHYPLPSYIGSNNYIETDIEISKFYLSSIRNGMAPSKMIQFFKGEPSEDKKRAIERRFKEKFAGSENAGQFILVFNQNESETVKIDDLSGSELDKMFVELNKTVQQEIYAGHNVTSPMLFGIKTEGQLGGTTELKLAYDIFLNTYAKPKADAVVKEIGYLLSFSNYPGEYELQHADPVGIQLSISDFKDMLPKTFVLKHLGVPEDEWGPEATASSPELSSDVATNDHIKNLTAKQHQELLRIIRQHSKGQLTEPAARTLLKTGLGLTDEDVNALLGIEVQMSADHSEDEILAMFDACGDDRGDYEILKSKKVAFTVDEAAEDETVFAEAFKYEVTASEAKILDLIKKDPKVTAEVIAGVIGQTVKYVESKIERLIKKGFIEAKVTVIGVDEVIERTVLPDIIKPPVNIGGTPLTKISIKYSYEGPKDDRNRPFCARMLELNRLYSRAEIESISERLGYSVWDRRGGWWTKPSGERSPSCRHHWQSNIVVKK